MADKLSNNTTTKQSMEQAVVEIDDTSAKGTKGAVFRHGRYHNLARTQDLRDGVSNINVAKRYFFEKNPNAEPQASIPLLKIRREELELQRNNDEVHLYRLGHSSILLKLASDYWLIDPVFSNRASPFSFLGPKRFHTAAIDIEGLPKLKGVLISHNHYDHLDKHAIKRLRDCVDIFIVPLGVKNILTKWGVNSSRIIELDWWQETQINDVNVTATPAQHFSGRGLKDRNTTLWCSYVINFGQSKMFFSGDSGYFDGFKTIGENFGPFDLVIMEVGGYDKDWPDVHMRPTDAVEAHFDLGGEFLLPIHNGTFSLAFHDWQEPFEQVLKYGEARGAKILFPRFGERLDVNDPAEFNYWWRGLE